MDTLCGIGLPELIFLALLAFVLIGPERSKDVALTVGRWLGSAMRSGWWKDVTQITASLRDLPNTLVRMAELEQAQAELQQTLRDIEEGSQVDFHLPRAEPDSASQTQTTIDPWGIRNVGRTAISPAPAPPPSEDPHPTTPQVSNDSQSA